MEGKRIEDGRVGACWRERQDRWRTELRNDKEELRVGAEFSAGWPGRELEIKMGA